MEGATAKYKLTIIIASEHKLPKTGTLLQTLISPRNNSMKREIKKSNASVRGGGVASLGLCHLGTEASDFE